MFARLRSDIQCILDRDPAARSTWEVITCYPGLHAVWLHRPAHWCWGNGLKWLGRFISHFARWYTDGCCACWYGFNHHRVAAYLGIVTHHKAAQYFGTGTHHDVFTQSWVALCAFVERCAAQGHALVNGATVANLGSLTHHHAHGMVEKNTFTHDRCRVNFNAG